MKIKANPLMSNSSLLLILVTIVVPTLMEIEENQKGETNQQQNESSHSSTPISTTTTLSNNKLAVLKMKPFLTDLRNQDMPLITEFPRWVQVNLSDIGRDELNPSGFIKVGCYRELTGFKNEELYNRTFRFVLQKKFEGINILCMLRFPTGLRIQYRFEFGDGNTYAFFAFGHNKNLTVATSRLISKFERDNVPFQFWKGVIFIPCRFSTLVFHPHAVGEIFEFRIIDHPHQYVDKCSELEKEYY